MNRKIWLWVILSLLRICDCIAQSDSIQRIHLVHVYAFVSKKARHKDFLPHEWRPRRKSTYILQSKDTVIVKPHMWLYNHLQVGKFDIMEIALKKGDLFHFRYISNDYDRRPIDTTLVVSPDTLQGEFIMVWHEFRPILFAKDQFEFYLLRSPQIHSLLQREIRKKFAARIVRRFNYTQLNALKPGANGNLPATD
jgi:hypothetical protein